MRIWWDSVQKNENLSERGACGTRCFGSDAPRGVLIREPTEPGRGAHRKTRMTRGCPSRVLMASYDLLQPPNRQVRVRIQERLLGGRCSGKSQLDNDTQTLALFECEEDIEFGLRRRTKARLHDKASFCCGQASWTRIDEGLQYLKYRAVWVSNSQ
jgi:hypothetical protein